MSAENKKPPFPMATYAFPSITPDGDVTWISPGMTLRDWFAGQALAGFLANERINAFDGAYTPKMAAEDAYTAADAMLEARK
jgi:hypothetical protein